MWSPWLGPSAIEDPFSREGKIEHRQSQNQSEEEPGQRRAIAEAQIGKCLLVDVQRDKPASVIWSAGRGDEGHGENLEGANDPENEIEEKRWRDHRQRNVTKLGPHAGPVDDRRLLQFSG